MNEDKAMDARLKKDNPRYPKIPVENIYLNPNPFAYNPDGDLMKKLNPWNTLEMMDKNVDRSELPIEDIKIEDLVPTQKFLNADNIDDVKDSEDDDVLKSTISKYKDKYYILDGHHRIARRILKGDKTIKSHVYNVDDFSNVYIGYHATNNPDSILENGFDENMINVAFSGRGFYFARDPKNLKAFDRKGIIKAKIN